LILSLERLLTDAATTGFRPEVLEKVLQLLNLLESLRSHPFLKGRLVMKGGTAINLFYFDSPRLSVDIDLNYIGAVDRETMLDERPHVEQAIQAVFSREGMTASKLPDEHAGGKWRLRYPSSLTESGNLEIDINYMFRIPLWSIVNRDSRPVGSTMAHDIPIPDIHELTAGKLTALLARHASRDLFDAHLLLSRQPLNAERLRLGFVVYGAMNRKDWRTVSIDDIDYHAREIADQLIPVVRRDFLDNAGGIKTWATNLVRECREAMSIVLPFSPAESEFLDRILDHGEILPVLLTSDDELQERIIAHPLLQWKALNVREHKRRL
jgi:predicted nucleotidyltransferase component of viral defense system